MYTLRTNRDARASDEAGYESGYGYCLPTVLPTVGPYRGTSPIIKSTPPWDPLRILGIGLR